MRLELVRFIYFLVWNSILLKKHFSVINEINPNKSLKKKKKSLCCSSLSIDFAVGWVNSTKKGISPGQGASAWARTPVGGMVDEFSNIMTMDSPFYVGMRLIYGLFRFLSSVSFRKSTSFLAIRGTWVWASSGSWWWTGKPGVLQSMGSQSVGHDWAIELTDWRVIKEIEKETLKCFKQIFFQLKSSILSMYWSIYSFKTLLKLL